MSSSLPLIGSLIDMGKAKLRDTLGASAGVAGPDFTANGGFRDPKPYDFYSTNGIFEGYDGSVWLYFKLPENVQTEWTRTQSEALQSQEFMLNLIDAIGRTLDEKESVRRDQRRRFHISLSMEATNKIQGFDGMTPAQSDYFKRMPGLWRPRWFGYIGFELKTGSIFHEVYGAANKVSKYIEYMKSGIEVRSEIFISDHDTVTNIAKEHGLQPLNFIANPLDFELLTAWFGDGDDKYGLPREVQSSLMRTPEHGLSIFTPKHGEIMFHAIKPVDIGSMFMKNPLNDAETRFGNAILAPSANTVHVNIRGEIRSSKAAKNLLENKRDNAAQRYRSLEENRQKGNGTDTQAVNDTEARLSDAEYALLMALSGHAMLDNVEIIVANRVTGKPQKLKEYLAPYGLTAAPLLARQHPALCSTVPCYPDTVFRVPSNNIKRNPNTLNMFGGVLALSGLFRSSKPCGPGGWLIGLSDSGYEFKEIYTELDGPYKYNGGPVVMVTGTTGSGKAMPLDQEIRLYGGGVTTFGNVQVGDKLVGMDGKPTEVTSLSPIKYHQSVYDMKLSDGRRNRSDGQHQWLVIDEKAHQDWLNSNTTPTVRSVLKMVRTERKKLMEEASREDMLTPRQLRAWLRSTVPDLYRFAVTSPYFWEMVEFSTNMTEYQGAKMFMKRVDEILHYVTEVIADGGYDTPLMLRRTTNELRYMMEKGGIFYLPNASATQCRKRTKPNTSDTTWEEYDEHGGMSERMLSVHENIRVRTLRAMMDFPCVSVVGKTRKTYTLSIKDRRVTRDMELLARSCGVRVVTEPQGGGHARVTMFPHKCALTAGEKFKGVQHMPNRRMSYTKISSISLNKKKEHVRCISVDNPSKTFLLGDYTVTSNTQQMLQLAAQTRYGGTPVFFLNPKPNSSLKKFFDQLGGVTINMSREYLEKYPGLMDPMFFIRDREVVAKVLAEMIINAMQLTQGADATESALRRSSLEAELIARAKMPHNKCSWDLIMGNRSKGTPQLSDDKILDFVHSKMKRSVFWRASISQSDRANEQMRSLINSGAPVLIEWESDLEMPTTSNSDEWSDDNRDAIQSVTNMFRFTSSTITENNKNLGGVVFVDEAHVLKNSEMAMSIVRSKAKTWRQANIRLVLATQELKEFIGTEENLISYASEYIIMQTNMEDEIEKELFYKVTGLPRNKKYEEYIANAGVIKTPGRNKPIPNGIYVNHIYKYISGFIAGPWPLKELSLGATDKEGEEAIKRTITQAAGNGTLVGVAHTALDIESEMRAQQQVQEDKEREEGIF